MKLNCEKDDIALVKATNGPNVGRFVRCVRLIPEQLWRAADGHERRLPSWELDGALTAWDGSLQFCCPDDRLQPLRRPGPDEVDEMVKLLGAPEERTPVLVGMGAEA